MKNLPRRNLIVALLLASVAMMTLSLSAATPKSEEELVAELSSPKEKVVTAALQKIEKEYPTGIKAIPAVKKLLTDPRPAVVRKAARVLGEVHADVSAAEVSSISELLKSTDRNTLIDGLKALRGLKAQSAIPQILPLLKHADKNVMRDSMRTLAVLGDKSLIPAIKPLLEYPDLGVQKDAADAIGILKEK